MVTIIIPCLNGERFIDRCINCILDQTYNNIEIIFVNDGSTDKTEDIIKERVKDIQNKGFSFKYIYQENRGVGSAIKNALSYINGDFLTLLDVDDYIMKDSIRLRVEFLKKNLDYDIVRSNGYYVSEDDINNKSNIFVKDENEKRKMCIFEDLITGKSNNWAGSYMVRVKILKEFYKDKEFYESKFGQNLQILLPIAYKGKAGFIDKPLMKYIRQEISLSQLNRDYKSEVNSINKYKEIKQHILKLILSGEELKKYLDILDITNAKYFMNLAYINKDKKLLEENFNILKSHRKDSIEDRILYYNTKNKAIGLFYRILRKLFRGKIR